MASVVTEKTVEQEKVYLCDECGFGYADRQTAESCEAYCSEHKACSLEISQKAIYRSE